MGLRSRSFAVRERLVGRHEVSHRELGLDEVGGGGRPLGRDHERHRRAAEGLEHRGRGRLGVAGGGQGGAQAPAGLRCAVEAVRRVDRLRILRLAQGGGDVSGGEASG